MENGGGNKNACTVMVGFATMLVVGSLLEHSMS